MITDSYRVKPKTNTPTPIQKINRNKSINKGWGKNPRNSALPNRPIKMIKSPYLFNLFIRIFFMLYSRITPAMLSYNSVRWVAPDSQTLKEIFTLLNNAPIIVCLYLGQHHIHDRSSFLPSILHARDLPTFP